MINIYYMWKIKLLKYGVIGVALILIGGCGSFPKLNSKQYRVFCPSGIGAEKGETPKIDMAFESGNHLLVCGFVKEQSGKRKYVMSEVDVYFYEANSATFKLLARYFREDVKKLEVMKTSILVKDVKSGNDEATISCSDESCEAKGVGGSEIVVPAPTQNRKSLEEEFEASPE